MANSCNDTVAEGYRSKERIAMLLLRHRNATRNWAIELTEIGNSQFRPVDVFMREHRRRCDQ